MAETAPQSAPAPTVAPAVPAPAPSEPGAGEAARPEARSALLRDLWYFALPSARLRPARTIPLELLGKPILFGRTRSGEAFAIRDICPHRGIRLSDGRFDGNEVECAYHGWRFDASGQCTAIPSLTAGQDFDLARIKVRRYPLIERQGLIWIFMGAGRRPDPEGKPEPPVIEGLEEARPRVVRAITFPCGIDHAVVGLMDPAHGPFVHTAWWWRKPASIHEKAKAFEPGPLGFSMARHTPSKNSAAYRLVGGRPTTEIAFRLPGIRIERIEAGRHLIVNFTAVTPVSETETTVTTMLYWTQPWLRWATPLAHYFAYAFLKQDRDIVARQQHGLAFSPPLMLIDDADTQAKWYYRLKRAWARHQEDGGEFVNPVKPTTLRWRS